MASSVNEYSLKSSGASANNKNVKANPVHHDAGIPSRVAADMRTTRRLPCGVS
jgi:hypothetical protein